MRDSIPRAGATGAGRPASTGQTSAPWGGWLHPGGTGSSRMVIARASSWSTSTPKRGAGGSRTSAAPRGGAGESAGEFLAGRELPGEPWFSRGFLRSILADGGFWATTMDPANAETWSSPPAAAFGAARRERVLGLWADREALLGALDRLPHTFSHGDLHPRNVLLPVDGRDAVAVDWSFCGIFPVGNDLADLIALAAWFCDIALD